MGESSRVARGASGRGDSGAGRRFAGELLIAARYLHSGRRDASIRFLSRMTAAGIALGVGALILAMAGLEGLQSRLLADATARTPALQVELPPATAATTLRDLIDELEELEGMAAVRELHSGLGWLRTGEILEPIEIVGVADGELPAWMPSPSVAMDRLDGALVPRRLSTRLGLVAGSTVELVSPRQHLGPLGPQPSTSFQEVIGSYDDGKDETRRLQLAVPLETARRLFKDGLRTLDLQPEDGSSQARLVAAVEGVVAGRGRVVRWQDRNRGLLFVLRLEKVLVFVAVALIVLVASFALVAAVSMIVSHKRAEIGILATVGLSPKRVRRLFTTVGALLAAVGAGGGAVVAVTAAWLLDELRVLRLPGSVYIVDHLPFLVRPSEVAYVLLCTFVFTVTAARLAARRASELDPVEALRK